MAGLAEGFALARPRVKLFKLNKICYSRRLTFGVRSRAQCHFQSYVAATAHSPNGR